MPLMEGAPVEFPRSYCVSGGGGGGEPAPLPCLITMLSTDASPVLLAPCVPLKRTWVVPLGRLMVVCMEPEAGLPGMEPEAGLPGMEPDAGLPGTEAGLPGMEPEAGLPGMEPEAGLPGMEPEAGLPGTEAGLPGMEPEAGLPGMEPCTRRRLPRENSIDQYSGCYCA
jgi:hypothetical protein